MGWLRLGDPQSAVSVQTPRGSHGIAYPLQAGCRQKARVTPRRKMGGEGGGHCWREEMGPCEAKVSFWRERAVPELCARPVKEAAMELPTSLVGGVSLCVLDTCWDRAGKTLSQASRVPLEDRMLSARPLTHLGSLHSPQWPSWKDMDVASDIIPCIVLGRTSLLDSLRLSYPALHPQILHGSLFPCTHGEDSDSRLFNGYHP